MIDANNPTFTPRINTVMKLVRKNIDMVESEPSVILIALCKLFCLYLVTELCHLPWPEVRRQSFQLFRNSLDEIHVKLEVVQSAEEKANDA
jgi:hypothetical protein